MQFGNRAGRGVIWTADGFVDIEAESGGRFGPDPQSVFSDWPQFRSWAGEVAGRHGAPGGPPAPDGLGPPVPRPRQVFAIGLNYREHASEAGSAAPTAPVVFTKFPACLTGPDDEVTQPTPRVDWEVELVAVIGTECRRVTAGAAWQHVAGLTAGQDLSARDIQSRPPTPQFSLAKSFEKFGPTGPLLVTVDEFADPDDLALSCTLNGETVQSARTAQLIFSVPALIEALSAVLPLLPGDLIFTGTPSGVGASRRPPRFLRPGDLLRSEIQGIGALTQRFREPESAA